MTTANNTTSEVGSSLAFGSTDQQSSTATNFNLVNNNGQNESSLSSNNPPMIVW